MRPPSELPVVSRFEADLLTILQGFLGHLPRSQLLPLLIRPAARPPCLSRTAVELIEDALAKGATLLVAQEGWRQERFLRGDLIVSGRVWQRTAPTALGIEFSPQSLDFLMWATSAAGDKQEASWSPLPGRTLALGDRWLLTSAYAAVQESEVGQRWSQREPWRSEPLCRLLFAADFEHPAKFPPLDFSPWISTPGLAVLEAWQSRLAERWVEMERTKSRVTSPQRLRSIASSQCRALGAFLDAIDHAGRRDLARFLLVALGRLLQPGATVQSWISEARLTDLRLADRQQAYRDALAFVQQFSRLEQWQAEARGIGYFDDHYQAAQLWKSDWEAYNGETLATSARSLLDQTRWV